MSKDSIQTKTEIDKDVNQIVDDMTLFDDDLMTLVFNKNIPATELILRIIMGRNIRVIRVDAQEEMRSPVVDGRDITLDILAIDEDGEEIDIEVQGNSEGSHVRRARFHSAVLDSRMLKEGDPFKILKDSYVIFIYKHDKFSAGLPIYRSDRVVLETGKPMNDGSHIIYVNGSYKGDDEIGKLMHDFNAKSSKDMNYKVLAEGLHHFKETKEGRDSMCEAVEKYAEKKAGEKLVNSVQALMESMKLTLEQALDTLKIQDEDRTYIIQQLQK